MMDRRDVVEIYREIHQKIGQLEMEGGDYCEGWADAIIECQDVITRLTGVGQKDLEEDIKLKHCPFCGGEANYDELHLVSGEVKQLVMCSNMNICGVRPQTALWKTRLEAAVEWNRRADE